MAEAKPGNRYRALSDVAVYVMISYSRPYTGGGEATLPAGECFVIESSNQPRADSFVCRPERYKELEEHFVGDDVRNEQFGQYAIFISSSDIWEKCESLDSVTGEDDQ